MDADILASLIKRFPWGTTKNGLIRSGPIRLAFAHIKKPRENDDGGENYEITALIPKGADFMVLNKALETTVRKEHGEKAMDLVRAEKIAWPLKDQGKLLTADGEAYDFTTPGARYFSARSSNRPRIMDRTLNEVGADVLYRGCWVLATMHTYSGTYQNKAKGTSKKYLSIGLNNLQFIADDDRLGGGGATDPLEEFEAVDGNAPTGFGAPNGAAAADPYNFD